MGRIITGFILLVSLGSCYQNIRPPDFDMSLVIPADSMVSLLTDLHMADAMVNIEQKKSLPAENLAGEYFHTVLQKHQVSYPSFEESMRYYVYHAETFNAMYEEVIVNLSKLESQVVNKPVEETQAD